MSSVVVALRALSLPFGASDTGCGEALFRVAKYAFALLGGQRNGWYAQGLDAGMKVA